MDAEYNDINRWDYTALVDVMGGAKTSAKHIVKTKSELETLLTDAKFNSADCLQFVEVIMQKDDAPSALVTTAEASAKTNAEKN